MYGNVGDDIWIDSKYDNNNNMLCLMYNKYICEWDIRARLYYKCTIIYIILNKCNSDYIGVMYCSLLREFILQYIIYRIQ